jgi:very-short-patch-repair endonuclease
MKKVNTQSFVKNAIFVHGNRYDYSKVEYKSAKEKVCIICPEHGEFWQTPANHLSGQGCPICADLSRIKCKSLTKEEFIEKARNVHGDKYDYSKVEYKNYTTKVCIICPEHGEFWQKPNNHLSGYGCKKCANKMLSQTKRSSKEEFIEKARKVHNDKYDYSKVDYINGKTKVCIICPKHGEFWQTPNKHLCGEGCPGCKETKLEKEVRMLLEEHGINFVYDKTQKWLPKQRLDFYLPDYNTAIECQGIQHFEPVDFTSSGYDEAVKTFLKTKKSDLLKKKRCVENNIKLLYFSNIEHYGIITDKNKLLSNILEQ